MKGPRLKPVLSIQNLPLPSVITAAGGPVGLLDEEVKVIGHQRLGDDAESEKGLQLAHENHEILSFRVSQDELPDNDAG